MCRGYQQKKKDRDRLKIKGFNIRLSLLVSNGNAATETLLPDSLTLHYLPRINGSPFEINQTKIRPDSPVFVTLHRLLLSPQYKSQSQSQRTMNFGSREGVKAGGGVRFEVYLGDEKLVSGTFRKNDDDEWKLDCKCVLQNQLLGSLLVEAEVSVAVEAAPMMMMCQRVQILAVKKKHNNNKCNFKGYLEEIPEEIEGEFESSSCCCCCNGGDGEMTATTEEEEEEEIEGNWDEEKMMMEMEMEEGKWGEVVDVGIWVICFGVAFLLSKASSNRLLTSLTTLLS